MYMILMSFAALQAILSHLLQLEARVSRLCDSCRLVVPVHLRKQGTAVKPLRAEVLVNYCHRQVSGGTRRSDNIH